MLRRFGKLFVIHIRDRQNAANIRASKFLQRLGIGDNMDSATHKQESAQGARCRIVRHFINAHLVSARAAFKEEVVQQIELEVAAAEYILARPEISHRIDRQTLLPRKQ